MNNVNKVLILTDTTYASGDTLQTIDGSSGVGVDLATGEIGFFAVAPGSTSIIAESTDAPTFNSIPARGALLAPINVADYEEQVWQAKAYGVKELIMAVGPDLVHIPNTDAVKINVIKPRVAEAQTFTLSLPTSAKLGQQITVVVEEVNSAQTPHNIPRTWTYSYTLTADLTNVTSTWLLTHAVIGSTSFSKVIADGYPGLWTHADSLVLTYTIDSGNVGKLYNLYCPDMGYVSISGVNYPSNLGADATVAVTNYPTAAVGSAAQVKELLKRSMAQAGRNYVHATYSTADPYGDNAALVGGTYYSQVELTWNIPRTVETAAQHMTQHVILCVPVTHSGSFSLPSSLNMKVNGDASSVQALMAGLFQNAGFASVALI